MSRIGKKPIAVPAGVEVKIDGRKVTVKGPKGEISREFNQGMNIALENNEIVITRPDEENETRALHGLTRALHGLTRALLHNMVVGVTEGFSKKLEIVGVGYHAKMQGKNLNLTLGFSHPVVVVPPEGVEISTPSSIEIVVSGVDAQKVGQVAAEIRSWREPEPYKGKGIRYSGEHVRRKAGKTGAK